MAPRRTWCSQARCCSRCSSSAGAPRSSGVRARTLAAAVACYAIFTAAAALAQNVWQLGVFRFLAGVGIGGEWALAGTYVAEVWPESRRKMGAGYLQTGYYVGFFLAAALNYSVGAAFGWRAMFLCGGAPVVLSLYIMFKVKEPE